MKRTILFLTICVLVVTNLNGVAAGSFQLSGIVTNQAAAPIAGTRIDVVDPGSGSINATAFTDLEGRYALSIVAGTYDIKVTPPSGTDFQPVTLTNQVINENTTINFILIPSEHISLVTVSGRISDRFGNGVAGAVEFLGAGVGSDGSYSRLLAAGDHPLRLMTVDGSATGSVPRLFDLSGPALTVNQDTAFDITIPAINVHVHVQDPSGNPLANATIRAIASAGIQQSLNTSRGLLPFTLNSSLDLRVTDSSGDAVMQLLPGDSPANYTFTVIGPSGVTQYQEATLNQVVTPEMNLNVVLEPKLSLVTVSGRISDRFGNGVAGAVEFLGAGVGSDGSYSRLLAAGDHPLRLMTVDGSATGSVPRLFDLSGPALTVNQDTVFDITIPAINVHVHVQDPSGNPLANAIIRAIASAGIQQSLNTSRGLLPFTLNSSLDLRVTDSSGDAVIQLLPGDSPANYTFTVIGPSGVTQYQEATLNQVVTPEMNLNVVLEPKLSLVTVSGRISDRFGNGVAGAVEFLGAGVGSDGSYSRLLAAGDHPLRLMTVDGSASGSVPRRFDLSGPALTVNQDTVFDITIPAINVHVHVQDPSGNPLANATIRAIASAGIQQSLNTSRGPLPFALNSSLDLRVTDSSGDAVMQLLPGDSPAKYHFLVTPPFGGGLMSFEAPNISVTPDLRLVFALQFINRSPQAFCRNVIKRAGNSCLAFVSPDEVNNGSSDPDQDPLVFSLSPSGPYGLGNTPVTLTVTDDSGISDSCTAIVSVVNEPATLSITNPPSGAVFAVNTAVNFSAVFSDADGGTHSAQWRYDTLTNPAIVTEPSGSTLGTLTATRTFTVAGIYPVSLEIVDSCGGRSMADTVDGLPATIVVYDNTGGSIAGGGSIESPAGAYVLNPNVAGRVIFGFQLKYQRGATAPEGSTEFRFQTANFRFSSIAYEWLVVSGTKVQFQGVGTVNGSGNYGFMVTAIDGDLPDGGGFDKLRLKVWDKSNGDAIVYDNQLGASDRSEPTTIVRGGSIIIR